MVEIGLAMRLRMTIPSMNYYYMGYYIHDCSKMRYKANFQPSMILDPGSLDWVPFEVACATNLFSL